MKDEKRTRMQAEKLRKRRPGKKMARLKIDLVYCGFRHTTDRPLSGLFVRTFCKNQWHINKLRLRHYVDITSNPPVQQERDVNTNTAQAGRGEQVDTDQGKI